MVKLHHCLKPKNMRSRVNHSELKVALSEPVGIKSGLFINALYWVQSHCSSTSCTS